MQLVIDTYNVLHAWRAGPLEESGRDVAALARLVGGSCFAAARTTLVCDGAPPGGPGAPTRYRAAA